MKNLLLLFSLLAGLLGAHGQAGSLDPSVAGRGWTYTDFIVGNPNNDEKGREVLVQNDGSMIVVFDVSGVTIAARYLSNGSLDPGFGINGFSDPIKMESASAVLQGDGKIVVAGTFYSNRTYNNDFVLARLNANGLLDGSFSEDGIVSTDFGGTEAANALAIQSDGKIVVAGAANGNSILARYHANGTLDVTFDGDGSLTTDVSANAIAVQGDGKIVIAGGHPSGFVVARFLSNGSPDNTFDGDGKVLTDFGTPANGYAMVIQNDGKIVVAGQAINLEQDNYDFALARYNTNGSLDLSFGEEGMLLTDFGEDDYARSIVVQNDDKIVVAGEAWSGGSGLPDFGLARYNPDGTLDATLDGDGRVKTDFGEADYASSVALHSDGRIVVAGYAQNISKSPNSYDLALARYHTNGSLDNTLDGDGRLTAYYPTGNSLSYAIAVQGDGKVVVAGNAFNPETNSNNFAVARYHPDGALDHSFGGDGIVTTNFSSSDEYARAIAIQADGKIVVAGYAYNGNTDFALARYNSDGTLDHSFDEDGMVTTDFGTGDIALAVTIQSDGKIIAAGTSSSDFALARYNPDGSLDVTFDQDGKVTTDFIHSSTARAVIVDNGKIIAAGSIYDAEAEQSDFAMARYHSDGSLDQTFDGDGKVTTNFGSSELITSISIQNDGKIVAAGSAGSLDLDISDFALARYLPDGSLDHSFDGDGKVITDFGYSESINALVVQNDGKIAVAGNLNNEDLLENDIALARYNPDGSLDNSFSGDGKVTSDLGFFELANAAAIHNNRLYVAGGIRVMGSTYRGFIAAYQLGTMGAEICGNKIDDNGDGQIDEGCAGLPFLVVDDISVPESQRRAVVTVRLSKKTDQKVFVDYYTRGGTARVKAFKQEGKDYEPNSGTLSIPVGKQSVSFVVKINNDEVWEKDEYFKVQLHKAVGATIRKAQATVTIVDDDNALQVAPAITGITAKEEKVGAADRLAVKVLPNPAVSYFTLVVQGSGTVTATIRIMDATGRLVEGRQGVAANATLQIGHHYRPGVYYAEVVQGKERVVVKLVKQAL